MTARKPAEVRRDLVDIGKILRELADEYTWAFGYAHSPTVRAVEGKASKGDVAYSDTTGEVVASEGKEQARELLADLADDVADAKSKLQRVRRVLRNRWSARGRDFLYLPDVGQVANPSDVAAAHEAQAKRRARGEVGGASPLPREPKEGP